VIILGLLPSSSPFPFPPSAVLVGTWLANCHGMATKSTTALETPLREQLDRLAAIEPSEHEIISLYLDMRPDQNGQRSHIETFLRTRVDELARTERGREGFDKATERISQYIAEQAPKSARGLAIFTSTTGDLCEAIPIDVPIEHSSMHVDAVPHLYPLARVNDQYPRYAALLVDTNSADLYVFALGSKRRRESIQNEKTRRTSMGGWSQARYQRRANNFHKQHMKEVVELLDKVVSEEHLNHIVIACDEVAKPFLMAQLPKHLADKVIDVVSVDVKSMPEHELLRETMDALRQADARTDAEQVQRMLDAWRAGGLAVTGLQATLRALDMRQVEELVIAARPDQVKGSADELVTKAQQNSARIRFIEDDTLLADVGGVGALLRFKI
jgi:peptide subunit release factor 1 (eRF1)